MVKLRLSGLFDYLDFSLSVSLFVCQTVCLSVCLFVRQSVCLPVRQSVCLSDSLSLCLSVCLLGSLCVCLSGSLFVCQTVPLSVCLFVRQSVCLSVRQSLCLSVCLAVRQTVCLWDRPSVCSVLFCSCVNCFVASLIVVGKGPEGWSYISDWEMQDFLTDLHSFLMVQVRRIYLNIKTLFWSLVIISCILMTCMFNQTVIL